MTTSTTISAQKIGDQLPDARRILGDRWTSTIVGDQLYFVSLNGVNQPTYRTFHETPLLGGVVTWFDYRQRQWNKRESIYEALSAEENLEGRVFGFRRTLLLLTFRQHAGFSYQSLYYWDTSEDGWRSNPVYIDPRTQIAGDPNDSNQRSLDSGESIRLITTAESDDYVYLITHDRSRGILIVAQLDTVGGYGRPGPARIDCLFEVYHESLRGVHGRAIGASVFEHKVWTLFYGHEDPTGAPARLLSTRMKDGHTEEIDLNAIAGALNPLTKQPLDSNSNMAGGKFKCVQCTKKSPAFGQGLCSAHWVFLIDRADQQQDRRELWSLDLREGRWRLLATPDIGHRPIAAAVDRSGWDGSTTAAQCLTRLAIPDDVRVASWHDPDMEFYGVSFDSGVYLIDVKRVLDDF